MALFDDRVISRPAIVRFAGFESTTTRLQQCGWSLASEQDIRYGRIGLMLSYKPADLYLMCEAQDYDFLSRSGRPSHMDPLNQYGMPEFNVVRAFSKNTTMILNNFNVSSYFAIDAAPTMITEERKRIEDFGIFATPLARTEEIIVEPQSVAECLELIRKMQAPELQALRERNRQRDRLEPVNQQVFHAQIMSLAA